MLAIDQERLSFLALHFVPGIGDYLVKQLIGYCGSASQVFQTPKGKLMKIPGVGEVTAASLKTESAFKKAEEEFRKIEKDGVEIYFFTDQNYPSRLKSIEDAPSLIYVKGNVNMNPVKTIGIVGTRQATSYGKENVERLVEDIVPHQALIVSGLAYGIDIHTHKQALQYQLPTLGIMGSGIDIIYPAVHKETAKKMLDHGGLLTENCFGTKPDAHNFPARNRIIAGLSDALIVVEAAEKGGALITAEIANSYNKDVFALPGNVGQTFSEGCNKLIKTNKAHLLHSMKDLEYIMNWDKVTDASPLSRSFNIENFEPDEQKVITVLKEKQSPVLIDELAWRAGLPHGMLASLLLTLEMKNVVQALPGKMFKLSIK
jgi:DNA processing protein